MGSDDAQDAGRSRRRTRSPALPCCLLTLLFATISFATIATARRPATVDSIGPALILRNRAGIEVHILPTGASIQRLFMPGHDGTSEDVVLGFDGEGPYTDGTSPYFGAVVGSGYLPEHGPNVSLNTWLYPASTHD